MNKDRLKKILELHKKWLNDEEYGVCADLRYADLQGAELRGANLQYANLQYADLRGADLRGADLQGADLRGANLQYADLRYADLRGADLRGADLQGADLDMSCFPLWCGSLDVHIDDRLAIQLLFHLIKNVLYSKNTSKTLKKALGTKKLIKLANKFHRAGGRRIEVSNDEQSQID